MDSATAHGMTKFVLGCPCRAGSGLAARAGLHITLHRTLAATPQHHMRGFLCGNKLNALVAQSTQVQALE